LLEHAAVVQKVVLDSPARLVMCGSHFSSLMTPPKIFKKMLPYYQAFSQQLHRRDKLMVCHADADTSLLMELLVEAGYDLMDSFVTAPMVPVTLERARQVFGDKVIIWGGLPSVLLCEPFTDEEFETYMRQLFRTIAPGDAFILAVADNIMLESKLNRLERVADMVEEYGAYPIETSSP
jgi:uroporphyrinogen-III decarboxylase